MEYAQILLALEELAKWKQRRARIKARMRRLESRKRFLSRELVLARERLDHFSALAVAMRTDRAAGFAEPGGLR